MIPVTSSYWARLSDLYSHFFAWFTRRMPNERQRLLAVTILAGGLCGLAAVAFYLSIGLAESLMIVRANAAPGHSWIWWTILTPALGGLVAGLGLTYFVPAAVGSGIPQVKAAYSLRHGLISFRETFVVLPNLLLAHSRSIDHHTTAGAEEQLAACVVLRPRPSSLTGCIL
jgi:H+/Cl- antiporter ClcA